MLLLENIFTLFQQNVNLSFYLLAALFCIVERTKNTKLTNAEILFRWLSLIYLSGTYLFAAIEHLTLGNFSNAFHVNIVHSYHIELAGLDLIFALVAIGGFKSGYGYRILIALFSAVISWFHVGDHVWNASLVYHYQFLTIAQILDISVPFILICHLPQLRPK